MTLYNVSFDLIARIKIPMTAWQIRHPDSGVKVQNIGTITN